MGGRAGSLVLTLLAVCAVLAAIVAFAGTPVRATAAVRAGACAAAPVSGAVLAAARTPASPAGAGVAGMGRAAAAAPRAPGPRPAWRWPLPPPRRVLRGFAPPEVPWGAGHRGVDLAAQVGRSVRAAGAGLVGYAGRIAGRGIVTIRHGDLRTTYQPVAPSVRSGELVEAGDRIGVIEPSGLHCGQADCLHWGLLRADRYLDPLRLLGMGPLRLLPVEGPSSRTPPGRPVTPARPEALASAPARPHLGRPDSGRPASVPRALPPARDPGVHAGPSSSDPGVRGSALRPGAMTDPSSGVPMPRHLAAMTGAAAGGAGMILLLLALPRLVRALMVRFTRRRRVPGQVVDFTRERRRRRGRRCRPDAG